MTLHVAMSEPPKAAHTTDRPAARRPATSLGVWRIFGAPIVLGVISTGGLIAGLLDDGIWDVVAWLGLGIPVAVIVWFWAASRQRRR
jgi:hypothetical protein